MVALRKGNYMYKLGKRETILDFNFSHQWIDREKNSASKLWILKRKKKTETKIIFYIPYGSLTNSDNKYYTFLQKQITYRWHLINMLTNNMIARMFQKVCILFKVEMHIVKYNAPYYFWQLEYHYRIPQGLVVQLK